MEKVSFHGRTFKPFISNEEIEKAIDKVAERLTADYAGDADIPMFVCVLNGAIMFTAAVMKRVTFPAELISVKAKSYSGTTSTGTVLIPMGLTGDVSGRKVILFEDIVDTGNTIIALKDLLLSKGAKDVKICTMLLKPDIYQGNVPIDYVAMEIPDEFILGYGLDYDELGRNLKDIYILEK